MKNVENIKHSFNSIHPVTCIRDERVCVNERALKPGGIKLDWNGTIPTHTLSSPLPQTVAQIFT